MKPGDIVYHKASDEPMVVLTRLSTMETEVRRLNAGSHGSQFESTAFLDCELETPEERDKRVLAEIVRRHKMSQAAQKDADIQDAMSMPAGPFAN